MTRFALCLILSMVCKLSAQRPSSSHRSDVYIAGFFPYGDGVENAATGNLNSNIFPLLFTHKLVFLGRGVMPSVKLALDHVNEHSNILSNYRLHMWWNDTEVICFNYLIYFSKIKVPVLSAMLPLESNHSLI